jgi:hypothetical protein
MQLRLAFFSSYITKSPFSVYLGDLDLNGDGSTDDLLPSINVNQFNRGLGKNDLRRLVNEFNQAYAGRQDAQGSFIPSISLPSHFESLNTGRRRVRTCVTVPSANKILYSNACSAFSWAPCKL